jgi:small subunit ribosomal protein S9
MADEPETPETPAEETPAQDTPAGEAPAEHAVPTEEASEIAGSAEDAPLEAFEEAQERPEAAELVEEAVAEEVAEEIVEEAVAEEVVEEAVAEEVVEEAVAEEVVEEAGAEEIAEEVVAEAVEAEEYEEEIDEEPPPREKPAVPGAHLEVDIVPEGVDPLGRGIDPGDPYASVAKAYEEIEAAEAEDELNEDEEALAEPISTAAIDLASGARYRATGKRKTAIARVTLRPGTGTYLVNGRVLEEHFPRITLQRNIRQPLETVGYQERMDVVARLHGGGISAQAGALRHGVSRALLEADPNLRGELKRRGFLTRDSRAKERKKAGLKKARKRPQFSKR